MGSLIYDGENHYAGKEPWWKDAVLYQVYLASFKESDADGWGDLPSLISEVDYLSELGVMSSWSPPSLNLLRKT